MVPVAEQDIWKNLDDSVNMGCLLITRNTTTDDDNDDNDDTDNNPHDALNSSPNTMFNNSLNSFLIKIWPEYYEVHKMTTYLSTRGK